MSWPNLIARGSGTVKFRVSIEGFPYEAVSSRDMETTAADGRIRYAGLDSSAFRFKERTDLVRAKWEPEGFRVTLVDRQRQWTEAFRRPTATTYLDAVCTHAATAMSVKATSGFASNDRIWVNTEVCAFTGTNTAGTVFQGLTRGDWDTLAQSHYVATGESARFPEVTNWPVVREGRRVSVYAYTAGESPTGNGTKIWTGIVSTEPTFNGMAWEIRVDPLSRTWSQDLGADLEDPVTIRGIYYNKEAALILSFIESSTTTDTGSGGTGWVNFAFAGFWETQQDFCDTVTSVLDTRMSAEGFTNTVRAVVSDDGRWRLQFDTPSSSPKFLRCRIISPLEAAYPGPGEQPALESDETAVVGQVATSTRYQFALERGGTVPRAVFGRYTPSETKTSPGGGVNDANRSGLGPSDNPLGRIYLNRPVGADVQAALIDWESDGPVGEPESASWQLDGLDADATAGWIKGNDVSTLPRSAPSDPKFYSAVSADAVSIRLGRSYGTGSLIDLITALTVQARDALNLGGVPDIRGADFTPPLLTELPDAVAASPLGQQRTYTIFSPVSFEELLMHECRLIGVYPAYASDGTVTFRRLRLPGSGEFRGTIITAADIITGGDGWLGWEPSALGQFNTVELLTGYDAVEDEHVGRTEVVRDVEAHGQNPYGRVLTIAPKSAERPEGYNREDVVRQASLVLGTFGSAYAYLRIRVKFTLYSLQVGDVVGLTWAKVPNASGTLGVTNKACIVVGREWDFGEASGVLTLMLTDQNVAGYTPSSRIDSVNSGTSNTTGPFGVTLQSTYFPGSTTAEDFFVVGDLIRVFRWNNILSAPRSGTITAVSGNDVTFTTLTGWPHSGSDWILGYRPSTSITADNQKGYAYIADSTGKVDFSGSADNDPYTFGP